MDSLFELADFEETRVEWVPLYKPIRANLLSLIVHDRCRDCGTRTKNMHTGGASAGLGVFVLCEPCASLDRCTTRTHSMGPEFHASRWGMAHRASEHDELIAAREKRRTNYLRKAEA